MGGKIDSLRARRLREEAPSDIKINEQFYINETRRLHVGGAVGSEVALPTTSV